MTASNPGGDVRCVRTTSFSLLLLLFVSASHAGWNTTVRTGDDLNSPCSATIAYAHLPNDLPSDRFNIATFEVALEQLRKQGQIHCLGVVVLYGEVVDPRLQKEVIALLKERIPELFAIARDSPRGTYEDPELRPLHRVFDEVVLETAYIQELNEQLQAVGKRVANAAHEKLSFRKNDDGLVIHFHLGLDIEDL